MLRKTGLLHRGGDVQGKHQCIVTLKLLTYPGFGAFHPKVPSLDYNHA
jgi:hypothetical protein